MPTFNCHGNLLAADLTYYHDSYQQLSYSAISFYDQYYLVRASYTRGLNFLFRVAWPSGWIWDMEIAIRSLAGASCAGLVFSTATAGAKRAD